MLRIDTTRLIASGQQFELKALVTALSQILLARARIYEKNGLTYVILAGEWEEVEMFRIILLDAFNVCGLRRLA